MRSPLGAALNLNQPNLGTLHSEEEDASIHCIALEFVEKPGVDPREMDRCPESGRPGVGKTLQALENKDSSVREALLHGITFAAFGR